MWRFKLVTLPTFLRFCCSARWIGNHGFTIGIDDVQPGKLLNEEKQFRINEGYRACDGLIKSFNEGKLTLMPGCDAAQTLEAKITQQLNEIREIAGKVMALYSYPLLESTET